MVPNYDTVAPNDTMVWEFRVSGPKDSFSDFKIAENIGFQILVLLGQGHSTKQQLNKNGYIYETNYRYLVKAKEEGDFLAGMANVKWHDGRMYSSEPVAIRVRQGHKNRFESNKHRPQAIEHFLPGRLHFPTETLNGILLSDQMESINKSSKQYAVIVGWLQTDVALKDRESEILEKIDALFSARENLFLIDSSYRGSSPRRNYYATGDTTDLLNSLTALSKRLPYNGTVTAIITKPREWNAIKETYAFEYELLKQRLIHSLEKEKGYIEAKSKKKNFPLKMQFIFTDLAQMEIFCDKVRRLDYLVTDLQVTPTDRNSLYKACFVKSIFASAEEVDKTIMKLTEIGKSEDSRGVFNGIGVETEKL